VRRAGRARILEGNQAADENRSIALFQSAAVAVEKARELAPRDVYFSVELALINDALRRFTQAETEWGATFPARPQITKIEGGLPISSETLERSRNPDRQGRNGLILKPAR